MHKIPTNEIGKFAQFFPFLATIVTSHYNGKDNAMAVAWHMPLSADPALYGVGISSGKLSHEYITKSKVFGVNFMPFEAAELVAATGGPSGRKINKFKTFNLKKDISVATSVPILSDAYAAFECVVEEEVVYGDHTLFVGTVVALHQAPEAYDEKGRLNLDFVKPTLYLGGDQYLKITGFETPHISRVEAAENLARRNG